MCVDRHLPGTPNTVCSKETELIFINCSLFQCYKEHHEPRKAQWVRCLLYMHEFNPSSQGKKKPCVPTHTCNPGAGEVKTGVAWGLTD